MKIEISDEVTKRATKCHANFSCLNDKENPKCLDGVALCPVESHIGDGIVFVNSNNDPSCSYSIPFADERWLGFFGQAKAIYK
jgi:hypothetical protein